MLLQVEKIVYRDKIVEVGKVDNSRVSGTIKTEKLVLSVHVIIYIYIYIYSEYIYI